LNKTEKRKQPITVDVKWVQENHMITSSLQWTLRKSGVLPFSIVEGTTKILYKYHDIENIIKEQEVEVS